MKKQKEKCEFMILTPHFDSGHNGGMWCNENYPCEQHGKWKDFNLERVNSTLKPSVKENKLYQKYRKEFPLDEIDFSEDYDKIFAFITSELETARKETKEEERKFILNILDGIDEADKQMNNKGGGTRAIRLALKSRI